MSLSTIEGRLLALEVLTMTALGLYLANARNDPDASRATALLDFLRQQIAQESRRLVPAAQRAAIQEGDRLLALVAQSLPALHGQSGQSH